MCSKTLCRNTWDTRRNFVRRTLQWCLHIDSSGDLGTARCRQTLIFCANRVLLIQKVEVLLKKKTFFLEETKLSIKVIVCLTSRLGFNCISAVPVSLITFRVEKRSDFLWSWWTSKDEKGKFRDKKLLWVTWSLTGSTCYQALHLLTLWTSLKKIWPISKSFGPIFCYFIEPIGQIWKETS